MDAEELKIMAARAALEWIQPDTVLGVGTGSTVNHFIDLLAQSRLPIVGAVSSSEATAQRLQQYGIAQLSLDEVIEQGLDLPVYVDGADEIEPGFAMIKGGGAALTREKILAAAAGCFVCIVDSRKQVAQLGAFPLPIEVIPMAVGLIARQLKALGARPVPRDGVVTDNGNRIIDAHDLRIDDPRALETRINQWPGVVTVGLFALRGADVCLVASEQGVRTLARCPSKAAPARQGSGT